MRLARCRSVALAGVRGTVVDIEVHIGGMPGFTLVGLPDASLAEARDRVRAAVLCSGERWPLQRITVSLSPAALPKRGSHFDLGVAVAIVAAGEDLPPGAADEMIFLGELALDGRLRPVPGVLPAVLAAAGSGATRVVVPEANAGEARLVPGVSVLSVRSLRQVLAVLRGEPVPDEPESAAATVASGSAAGDPVEIPVDLADVADQQGAKRAVEVASAGHHHLMLTGPPGAGKTMLARRLPGLLPDLSTDESLEVTAIHSVAGVLPIDRPLVTRPPFADPHHTASVAAVVGGGSRLVRPGAASRAHLGVLFMDEAPEFGSHVLDALRQPLEHGEIVVSRAESSVTFPARFLLVLASNPCRCGNHGSRTHMCSCTPDAVRRYAQRISGPVRDRIDLRIVVEAPTLASLDEGLASAEPSKAVAERVAEARDRQRRRLAETPWRLNGEVPGPVLRRDLRPPPASLAPLHEALRKGQLTARGADRVLRVAWTLADLAGHDRPSRADVGEAVGHRLGRPG
ncbi:MAG TPA: YifB family Mg chelatase-like AAA ATPase [Jiangellaceae bacterium]|nr:YifB family Mg chelatase-like AAA ATPase [Jiangellaceae bacterium]